MKSQRKSGSGISDSTTTQTGAQIWETGYQSLFEGWHQAQEFWNNAARSWGEGTGAWLEQFSRPGANLEVVRELQEATIAVAQAWMRLPLVLTGGARLEDLQNAVTQLTKTQGRAYQLWLEALQRSSTKVSTEGTTKPAGKKKQ